MEPVMRFGDDISDAARRPITSVVAALGLPELRGSVDVALLSGGAMNENFTLAAADGRFVLRIAGLEVDRFGIDRERSILAHRSWESVGVSPRLRGFVLPSGHCVSDFVEGRTLDQSMLRDSTVLTACVETLLVAHNAPSLSGSWSIFEDSRRYLRIARSERISLPSDIDAMAAAMDAIEASIAAADIPVVLAHNDLQVQNYIVDPEGGAWLIDLEYAAMSNPYLDLGMLAYYGGLSDDLIERALTVYFGQVRPTDRLRLIAMYFAAAIREATWSVCAQPVLGALTGWDYAAWAEAFFDKARGVLGGHDLAALLVAIGPDEGDKPAFALSARNAGELRPRFEARAARRQATAPSCEIQEGQA